jgi:hypothetical protein
MTRRMPRPASRTHRSAQERDARSQAVQRVAEHALLRGSLVEMRRTCGKKVAGANRVKNTQPCVWRFVGAGSGR